VSEDLVARFMHESHVLYEELNRISSVKEIAGERCVIVTPGCTQQLELTLCRWASAWGLMVNEEMRAKGLIHE
jgi:hypothetical protein